MPATPVLAQCDVPDCVSPLQRPSTQSVPGDLSRPHPRTASSELTAEGPPVAFHERFGAVGVLLLKGRKVSRGGVSGAIWTRSLGFLIFMRNIF